MPNSDNILNTLAAEVDAIFTGGEAANDALTLELVEYALSIGGTVTVPPTGPSPRS